MRRPSTFRIGRARARTMRAGAAAVLIATLGACQIGGQMGGANAVAEPAMMMGMGCEEAEAFAFTGETTLAALGLSETLGTGPDSQRRGMVWVTADEVNMNGPGPMPAGMEPMMSRMVCIQWDDGSAMGAAVPADWAPPTVLDAAVASDEGGSPLVLIGLVVAASLIVAVSYLAFREERR